jgi:hypothetical protein
LRGNVLTEIQMHTKSLEDINRAKDKYGPDYALRISRQEVGVGMLQNPKYNKGNPYFVKFRPLLHEPHKITDEEMEIYKKLGRELEEIYTKIEAIKQSGVDTTDVELEFRLASDKLKTGAFRMTEIYIESLNNSIAVLEKKKGGKKK